MPNKKKKSIGALVVNQKNQFLLIYQTQHQYWEFPKGGVEKGETDLQTLERELKEETGLTKFSLISGFQEKVEFTFRGQNGQLIDKTVVYYLLRLKAGQKICLSPEHQGFVWLDSKKALSYLIHDNQRTLLKKAQKLVLLKKP